MRILHLLLAVGAALCALSPANAQESYCTLGDYVYGNAHGSFNDVPTPVLLDSLITDTAPLVIGMPGRSVTFMDGSEPAIIRGLTASWKPVPLPDDLGDAVIDSTCELPPEFPAQKNGKFRNSLLGETITLSLNTRLDPDLGPLEVCPIMYTVAALPGEDGLYNTEDDTLCAECDTMTIRIPEEILAALSDTSGAGVTVDAILDLANLTLAGQDTLFDVTPKQVATAVKVLNRGFKRCRYLVDCVGADSDTFEFEIIDVKLAAGTWTPGDETPDSRSGGRDSGVSLSAAGPVSDVATIHFSVPEPCRAKVAVYNVAGRVVGVLVDGEIREGPGSAALSATADRLPSGVYFVRLRATGINTGQTYAMTSKMLVVR